MIQAIAVPVLPGEWKIHAGLIPIPLNLPTVIGCMWKKDVTNEHVIILLMKLRQWW